MSKKHVFQMGDRVRSVVTDGSIGHLIREEDDGWLMLRDDKVTGRYDPYWWAGTINLQHDRDFQVGDWVRYEMVKDDTNTPWGGVNFTPLAGPAKIKTIGKDGTVRLYGMCTGGKTAQRCYIENIVKIQSPDKQEDQTMPFKKFNHADKVELIEKGSEIASSSLVVGDQGVVRDHKYGGYGWSTSYIYRVVFNTQNGPRSQWVWEEHLKKVETEKDPMLQKLKEKVEECRIASEKASRAHEEAVAHLNHYKDLLAWVK